MSERTPTNRIEGRVTASQIAAASAASVLPTDVRLHIGRGHHARLMAEPDQLARPMMRRPAGFKPHQTRWQRSEKFQQLVAPDRLGDHNPP
jgi:hypothetical protein